MKIIQGIAVLLMTSCIMAGCASNPMLAAYGNDMKIASATNSYNLAFCQISESLLIEINVP